MSLDAKLDIDQRLTCEAAGQHIPGCYNPLHDSTACVCGEVWWRGNAGGWHSHRNDLVVGEGAGGRPIYEPGPWKHYFLHGPFCDRSDISPGFDHRCTDVEPVPAAEFWGRS
ncbi:hypothetical protein [Isoptericola sp. NPDC055881]